MLLFALAFLLFHILEAAAILFFAYPALEPFRDLAGVGGTHIPPNNQRIKMQLPFGGPISPCWAAVKITERMHKEHSGA